MDTFKAQLSHSRLGMAMNALGLAGMVVLSALLMVISFQVEALLTDIREITKGQYEKTRLIRDAIQFDAQSVLTIRDLTVIWDPDKRRDAMDHQKKLLQQADEAMGKLGERLLLEEERSVFEKQVEARKQIKEANEAYIRTVEDAPGPTPRSISLAVPIGNLREGVERYLSASVEQQKFQDNLLTRQTQDSQASADRILWLLIITWLMDGGVLIGFGFLWHFHQREQMTLYQQRMKTLIDQRDVLVREVHHRIKNHLQGVLGMIESRQRKHPENAGDFDALLGHVVSLTAVHGLQARKVSEEVPICDLVEQQIALLKSSRGEIEILTELAVSDVLIPSQDAVPLALAVTELLINAGKHNLAPERPIVSLDLSQDDLGVSITIANPTARCPDINVASGVGMGTGLSLVKSMLIDLGILTINCAEGKFVACVRLEKPLVIEEIT